MSVKDAFRVPRMVVLAEGIGGGIAPPTRRHFLHVFSTFGVGGPQLRMVRVINHLGKRFRHTIIGLDDNLAAGAGLDADLGVVLLPARWRKSGALYSAINSAAFLRRLRPDLLLTYNWGAIDWAMANRVIRLSPHLHFEAGFGKEEANGQLLRRVLFRRLALARASRVVVPSRWLEDLASRVWRLPRDQVTYLPNGVDLDRFRELPHDTVPGFTRRPGELIIGTVAPLRPEKNIGRLLQAFARLDDAADVRLVVAGDGAERPSLEQLAGKLGLVNRVLFIGQVDPESVLGAFDVFALSSDTEQMPNALLEAMAASRAVAAVDVGDVKAMVCDDNRGFIVPRDDVAAFAAALQRLLRDPAKRAELGRKNRERVAAEFSQERMFSEYSDIFAALGLG